MRADYASLQEQVDAVGDRQDALTKDQWRLLREHVRNNTKELDYIKSKLDKLENADANIVNDLRKSDKAHTEALRQEVTELKRLFDEERAKRQAGVEHVAKNISAVTELDEKVSMHSGLHNDHKSQHDTLLGRLTSLESRMNSEHSQLAADMEACRTKVQGDLREHIEALKSSQDSNRQSFTDLLDLEKKVREEGLKDLNTHIFRRLDEEKSAQGTRDGYLEDMVNQKMETLQKKISNLNPKIVALEEASQESLAKYDSLREEIIGHDTSRDKHEARFKDLNSRHESLQQKFMTLIEDNQAKLLQDLSRESSKWSEAGVTLQDRVGSLEKKILQELAKETSTREADVYQLRDLIGGEKLAREDHFSSVGELLAKERAAREAHMNDERAAREAHMNDERAAREAHMNDVHGLVDNLQGAFKDTLESHAANERLAREEHHVSVQERLAYLESLLQDSASKHAELSEGLAGHSDVRQKHEEHIVTLQERFDAMKLQLREEIAQEVGAREADVYDLRVIIGGERLASCTQTDTNGYVEKIPVSRDAKLTPLQERIEYIEVLLQESAGKHSSLNDLLVGHRDELVGHREKHEAHIVTLQERFDALQAKMHDEIAQEKSNRESDTYLIQELVGKERDSIEELRQRFFEIKIHMEEATVADKATREAADKAIHDLMESERGERVSLVRDLAEEMNQLLQQESKRTEELQTKLTEAFETMQKDLRAEQNSRVTEDARLKQLLDCHSHDLSIKKDNMDDVPTPTKSQIPPNSPTSTIGRPMITTIGAVREKPQAPPRGLNANAIFNALDRNHDGVISRAEFNQAAQAAWQVPAWQTVTMGMVQSRSPSPSETKRFVQNPPNVPLSSPVIMARTGSPRPSMHMGTVSPVPSSPTIKQKSTIAMGPTRYNGPMTIDIDM